MSFESGRQGIGAHRSVVHRPRRRDDGRDGGGRRGPRAVRPVDTLDLRVVMTCTGVHSR